MIRTKAECKRRYDAAPGAEDFFTFPVFFAALCEKHALDRFSRDVLSKEARGALLSDADKLLSGYPLQYYLGEAEFFGQTFQISEGVLIPRADTEVLVREALACLPENGVLYDLCCGSGCIAISVLHKRPDAFAVAVDLSDRALETFIEILFYSDLDESKKASILKEALSYLDSKGYISFKLHSLITD